MFLEFRGEERILVRAGEIIGKSMIESGSSFLGREKMGKYWVRVVVVKRNKGFKKCREW